MIALVALAGCGGPAPGGNTTAAVATPDPLEAKIGALSTSMRRLAFFRAIYDAGYGCKEVVADAPRPRDNGRAAWTATCDDGREFYITLQPGGVFNVSGAPAPAKPRFKKVGPTPVVTPAAE